VSSRGRGCNPKSKTDGFSGTLRFKAKRVSVLRVVDAVVSADELGDGCNPYPYRFSAGADSFPDNYHREGYSWRWDFGAGVTSTEAKPRHTFPRSGRQAVSVSVRMTDGSVAKTTHLVDVAEPVEGC
jgi:PKD repeat protein